MLVNFELAARDLGLLEWDDWDEHFVLGRRWAANSIGFKLFCQYVCADGSLQDYVGTDWESLPAEKRTQDTRGTEPLFYRSFNPKSSHAPRCDTVLAS